MTQEDIIAHLKDLLDDFIYDYDHTYTIYGDGSRVISASSLEACNLEFKEMIENALSELIGG